MRFFEDYKVDGRPILVPDADIALSFADLDASDSGRDESGMMHRIVVRERVGTWDFRYSSLTAGEYQYMRSLFAGKPEFYFTYRAVDGRLVTTKAYCSNDSITYHNARLGVYQNLRFTVIEC